MSDPASPDFAARRATARARLDALPDTDPYRRDWFTAVYETAGDDPANVPWADLAPHPLLADWLATMPAPARGARALDVACGLGDNAEALAANGWRVSAFELSPKAIQWVRARFPASRVDYRVADLFALPADWRGAFDLVHECYTLQALSDAARHEAVAAIARMVAPGGRLVVIARRRDGAGPVKGPPWPLARDEIMSFTRHGLAAEAVEESALADGTPHWRAVFRRAGT